LKIDTLPGYIPGGQISWIASSNDIDGFPVYFVIKNPTGINQLYKYYGNMLFELPPPDPSLSFINIFTHPGQITGDTIFVSCFNTTTQEIELHRSFSGGLFGWEPVNVPGITQALSDADFSPDWVSMMPPDSYGLRLSFPGGLISDDLGDSWQGPGLTDYGIATHPVNIDLILGSDNVGVAKSQTGIYGPYNNTDNIGFISVNVNQFSLSQGICYVATDAGLAYTQEYFNPLITGYDQWIPPNGLFPVPNTGDEEGVTAVAIDPINSDHVICGYKNGFNVTFAGPNDFIPVTPLDWNNNAHLDPFVTDIKFITSSIIVATTGMKFKTLSEEPLLPVGNIWRSIDGGQNWSIVTPTNPPPDDYQMGNCLTVGTYGSQTIIYLGTGYDDEILPPVPGSLWVSYDLGEIWLKINDAPVFGGGSPLSIFDIDIDPTNMDIIYLSTDKVFARSDNGGLSYF
ncbi:MAG: glycoside hydrolase, partial [Bacteroidales bacterium]|nr:glycoside hydrolase [Bacteroidales bacterium]